MGGEIGLFDCRGEKLFLLIVLFNFILEAYGWYESSCSVHCREII